MPQAFAERWYGAGMSLDAATGVLTYDDGAQVDPSKPLAEFLTTPLGGSATRRHRDTWTWLELPARAIDGVAFVATLTFEGERLFSILLNRARPRRDWDQWSLAEEQAIVAEDTRWLAAAVGEGRHQFTWGAAGAGFDERGATAYLLLRYQR